MEENRDLKISYCATVEDWKQYCVYRSFKYSGGPSKNILLGRFIPPLVLILSGSAGFRDALPALAIVSVLWVVFYPRWYRHKIKENVDVFANSTYGKLLFGKKSLNLKEEFFEIFGEHSQSRYAYTMIEDIRLDDRLTYVCLPGNSAIAIPDEAFTAQVTKEQFVEKLERKKREYAIYSPQEEYIYL